MAENLMVSTSHRKSTRADLALMQATGGLDGSVLLWDVEKLVSLLDFSGRDFVYGTKLLGDTLAIAQKETDQQVVIYDIRSGKAAINCKPGVKTYIRCMDYCGDRLMAGTFNAEIFGNASCVIILLTLATSVWDVRAPKPLQVVNAPVGASAQFQPAPRNRSAGASPITTLQFDKRKVVYGGFGIVGVYERRHDMIEEVVQKPYLATCDANVVCVQVNEQLLMCSYYSGKRNIEVYRPASRGTGLTKQLSARTKKPQPQRVRILPSDDISAKGKKCLTM